MELHQVNNVIKRCEHEYTLNYYPTGSYTVCNWWGKKLGTIDIIHDNGFSRYEFGTSYIVKLYVSETIPQWYVLDTRFNGRCTNWLVPESGQRDRAEAIINKELHKLRFAWVRRYQ